MHFHMVQNIIVCYVESHIEPQDDVEIWQWNATSAGNHRLHGMGEVCH